MNRRGLTPPWDGGEFRRWDMAPVETPYGQDIGPNRNCSADFRLRTWRPATFRPIDGLSPLPDATHFANHALGQP